MPLSPQAAPVGHGTAERAIGPRSVSRSLGGGKGGAPPDAVEPPSR